MATENEPNTVETTGTIDPGNGDNQAGKRPPTAEEAKLLKEVMKHKAEKQALIQQLRAFDGIDPDQIRQLAANAEAAKAAQRKIEDDRLLAAGEWETYKSRLVADHQAKLDELHGATQAATQKQDALDRQIVELTVGSAFAASKFIVDDTILTPSKARKLYADHFDVEGGKVVPYDAPRGTEGRSLLADGAGQAMSFDQAMKRIVESDPERDALLRSSNRVAGARQNQGQQQARILGTGIDRIAGALATSGIRIAQDHQDAPDQPGPSLNHRNTVQPGPAMKVADRDVGPSTIGRAIKAGGLPKAAPPRAR